MEQEQRAKIEALYFEMFDKLMAYARCLENEALAEEAVQETFQIACQKPESLCNSPNPQGWLVNTLRNIIRNNQSRRANAKQTLERYIISQARDLSISNDKLSLELLYENVAELEEFKLLVEMAVEGKSHKEIAAQRGISVSTCKKRVQRAKETLQKKLKKYL